MTSAAWPSRHGGPGNRRFAPRAEWGDFEEEWTHGLLPDGRGIDAPRFQVATDEAVLVGLRSPADVHGSRLVCVDADDGRHRWTRDFEPGLHTGPEPTPAVSAGTAFFPYGGTDMREHPPETGGGLVALDVADGSVLWHRDDGQHWPPTVRDGTVYAVADGLRTYDADDGTEQWRASHGDMDLAGRPAVADVVVVRGLRGGVAAFDPATGTRRWRFGGDFGGDDPVVAGHSVLTTTHVEDRGMLHALDLATGERRWSFAGRRDLVPETPAVDAERVFLLATTPQGDWGELHALNRETGHEVWRRGISRIGFDAPVAAGDVVVQGTTDGRLVGFDAATGDPLGEYRVPDARVSSPAVCGTRYVVGVGNDATAVRALTVGR